MVVAHSGDAGERHRRQLRRVSDGRGHRQLAVRRRCGDRRRARWRGFRRVRPPRVIDRQRGARGVRVADDRLPEGHPHAIRRAHPAGRRVWSDVHHHTHVRRRDSRTRNKRFLSITTHKTNLKTRLKVLNM